MARQISLKQLIGGGYQEIWNCKERYLVLKGSRASKKSKTIALRIIYNIIKYEGYNALCIRAIYNTLKDSCYTELIWAIHQFGVTHLFKCTTAPLMIEYIPTGQRILFKGLDKAESITSITVPVGKLCHVWWEESSQIKREEDINKVDLSIRGELPEGCFYQHIFTFNPWSPNMVLKKKFYEDPPNHTAAFTTTYMTNEFLDEATVQLFEEMKVKYPKRYKVEGLGEFGSIEGLIYDNWEMTWFDPSEDKYKNMIHSVGLDFGYTDITAVLGAYIDEKNKEIWVYDEIAKNHLLNDQLYKELVKKGWHKATIFADNEDPRSIQELKRYGCARIRPCTKGRDSINQGIQKVQQYKIYIHPRCEELLKEIQNYVWEKDRNDELTGKPDSSFGDHELDALRYLIQVVEKDFAGTINKGLFKGL